MTSRKKLRLIDKLEREYHRAEVALIAERGRIYPPGTKIRCKVTRRISIIAASSLYADQVGTNHGHFGWRHFDVLDGEDTP